MNKLYNWQTEDYNHLINLTARLPAAILLHGAKGLGKLNLAHNFIAGLFCESTNATIPCAMCQSCNLLASESHPDLYILRPNEDSEKKLKLISVDDVRIAIQFSSLTNHMAKYKVILIEDTNLLNINSANALLKILEEPPANLLFLLLSDNLSRVLATIKSRCYKYAVSLPDYNAALDYLTSQNLVNADFWLNYYNGAPLFSVEVEEEQLQLLLNTLTSPSIDNIFTLTNEFDGKTISFEFILEFLTKWIADLLSYKTSKQLNYFSLYEKQIAPLLVRFNSEKAFYLADKLNFFIPWVNHPLNYKLQIENLLLAYQQVFTA